MTKLHALTQMAVKNLAAGKHPDGQGLWLVKRSKVQGRWMLRLSIASKRREMGLGPWPDVSLAEARDRAAEARYKVRDGIDPINERQQRVAKLNLKRPSVSEIVELCFVAKKAELKRGGEAGRWMSPLKTHVLPKIGPSPIEELDQHTLKRLLDPIWHSKPEAAIKALNRLSLTIKHAAAMGLDVDLQAVMKAKALLGKQKRETVHIPSLPYAEMPTFYAWLKTKQQMTALALRFLILTAARTSEIRFATFAEIEDDIWTIPAKRTKTSQEHRVPLSNEALDLLKQVRPWAINDLIFPTPRGNAMSDAAMSAFLKREGYTCRPHGFRASFRTWVEEQTDTAFEVKEHALGHKVDTGVVGAYQRSDRLEKRRKLMEKWTAYLVASFIIDYNKV